MSYNRFTPAKIDVQIAFYATLIAWTGYLAYTSLDWVREDVFFPRLVMPLVAVLSVLKLAQLVRERGESTETTAFKLDVLIAIAALPVAIYVIGFSVLPVYVFVFVAYFHGDLRLALLTTAVTTAFIYVLFSAVLSTPFWEGLLGLPNLFEI